MPAVDSLTHVPSDVYAEFFQAGKRAKCRGQHVLVVGPKGLHSLRNVSSSQAKVSSLEQSSKVASKAISATLTAIPRSIFSSGQKEDDCQQNKYMMGFVGAIDVPSQDENTLALVG